MTPFPGKRPVFGLLLLGGALSSILAGPVRSTQERSELIWSYDTEG